MPAARPAPTPSTSRDRRGAGRLGIGVVGGLGLATVAALTVVRVQRLRGAAATHAHDLDHSTTVGEGLGDAVRLLVLGDSAARGYGLQDPAEALPQQLARRVATATGRRVHVTSFATDGHRTADVLDHQVPLVRAARPDAVVVSVGVNDAIGGTGRAELRAATHDLLTHVRAAADGAVLALVCCPDLRPAPGLPRPLNLAVGWRCRRAAAAQAGIADELDVAAVPLSSATPDLFGVDGFHPGAAGQAAMAEVAADALLARAGDVLTAATADKGVPSWTSH